MNMSARKVGKIYFVNAPGRIKIGYTTNPDARLASLRHVDMEQLSVIAITGGTRALEKKLHRELATHHLKNEWFVDCEVVREAISAFLVRQSVDDNFDDRRPSSSLNESKYVAEAARHCSELMIRERRESLSIGDALSMVSLKTGVSYTRVWQLKYRAPKFITAAELVALREAISGPASPAVAAAKAAVGET